MPGYLKGARLIATVSADVRVRGRDIGGMFGVPDSHLHDHRDDLKPGICLHPTTQ